MKKLFTTILLLAVGFSAFAEILVQDDISLFGWDFVSRTMTNPDTGLSENTTNKSFDYLYGNGLNVMWEFNGIDNGIYPFLGGGINYSSWGFPVAVMGGVNFNLFDFGPLSLELMTSLKAGVLVELWGKIDLFTQPSIDFIFLGQKRHGLYGGLGTTVQVTSDLAFLRGQNLKYYGITSLSGHFVMGYRF